MIKTGTRVVYTGRHPHMRRLHGVVENIFVVNRIRVAKWRSDKDIKENDPAPWMCPVEHLREEI